MQKGYTLSQERWLLQVLIHSNGSFVIWQDINSNNTTHSFNPQFPPFTRFFFVFTIVSLSVHKWWSPMIHWTLLKTLTLTLDPSPDINIWRPLLETCRWQIGCCLFGTIQKLLICVYLPAWGSQHDHYLCRFGPH